MKDVKNILILLFIFCSVSCKNNNDEQMSYVFKLAGKNASELEKVLEHYKNDKDPLKLRAAKYLILNMPGHCSYTGESLVHYYNDAYKIIFSDSNTLDEQVSRLNDLMRKNIMGFKKVEDCSIITAKYLINNIDDAFNDWRNGSYAKNISFEEFCEYLLPYKCIEFQNLDNWRNSLKDVANEAIADYEYNDIWNRTPYWKISAIGKEISPIVVKKDLKETLMPHVLYKVPFWCHIPSKACETYTATTQAIFRSKGIPVVTDFILQWATNSNSHLWLNVLIDHQKSLSYESGYDGFVPYIRPGECKGKIYRMTYAANPEIVELNRNAKEIPSAFQNIFMRDVTSEYVTPVDLDISIVDALRCNGNKYAYLSVFNNSKWTPITFARINTNGIIHFRNMEKGAIYLPSYYSKDDGVLACSYPVFVNENGSVESLKPDTTIFETITLKRKYPLLRKAYMTAIRLKGSVIQASNDGSFKKWKTLYRFDAFSVSGNVAIKDTAKYRYWRYFSNKETRCNIAELYFYHNGEQVMGRVIGSTPRTPESMESNHFAAFDNNPLTYFVSKNGKNGWVGLDFGKPCHITKVGYVIRNDDNNIRINDVYELFYWNLNRWESLGRQKAQDLSLTYFNVPRNALLLLRNLTRGNDERIFIYRNGRQVFY